MRLFGVFFFFFFFVITVFGNIKNIFLVLFKILFLFLSFRFNVLCCFFKGN